MGAGHSAEGDCGTYASDPPAHERRKTHSKRRRHSVDSVASYSSQNHVDRIRTQKYSATSSCQDDPDFGSIKTSLFRRSSSNLDCSYKRPDSVTSNTSSTKSRLRELVERKSNQEEHKSASNSVGDIQYFENPTETLEFDKPRGSLESKKSQEERPKKRKISKGKEKEKDKDKEKDSCEKGNKKHDKYQSKLAEYYKIPVQQPQDEFYQHLTRSKAAEDLLRKKFSNSDTEFNGSYGRLCKHKETEGSNLRRSRSLAVIREETFTDLQIQNHAKNKRSQLIPRARLFDKPCFKDRLPGRAKYQTKEEVLESIYIDSTASCFGDINAQKENEDFQVEEDTHKSEKEVTKSHGSHHTRSISGSWPNLDEDFNKNTINSEDSIGHSRNPSEIDSLDSNYVRKHYNFDAHRKGYKDSSPETERSVVTPDPNKQSYVINNQESDAEDLERSKNNTPKSFTNDSLSITQSDKDTNETRNDLQPNDDSYDEISLKSKNRENHYINEALHIDDPAPLTKEIDTHSILSENDGTVSSPPDSITSYISISIASSNDKSHKLEHLANSLAEKIDEYCETQYRDPVSSETKNTESNNKDNDPIYTQVSKKRTFADIRRDSILSNKSIINEIDKKQSESFVSNTYIENDIPSSIQNCTSSKNITTEPFVTTLIENQYYSLPDINISKCLRKSERIDAELRKEDAEDITCENTYDIVNSHFREILTSKVTENYGQLNKTNNNQPVKIQATKTFIPDYTEPQLIQNYTKLEDDLKSILTLDSTNSDDKDSNYYLINTHQNERELNEIDGTIRKNKFITKSESLKISNSNYRPKVHILKSLSQDNINNRTYSNKGKTNIRKHYSLRQRDPNECENHRLPSPNTVQKSITKFIDAPVIKPLHLEESKNQCLLSRVQSFKTSADSNIAIVPLSGHQTIVIDPPLNKDHNIVKEEPKTQLQSNLVNTQKSQICNNNLASKNKENKTKKVASFVDTTSYCTPKDPFITIKLNKVVKATIPCLKKETSDKVAFAQTKVDKPPPRLIIKDNNNTQLISNLKPNINMSRPQVIQVVDTKSKKHNTLKTENIVSEKNETLQIQDIKKEECKEIKPENVKEKLTNAIKTDIEYQEKLHSVKNYWSKLIDRTPRGSKEDISNDLKSFIEDSHAIQVCENSINDDKKDNDSHEISVGNIIKTLESVKIVDSIKKISQSKLQLWKEDTEKVKSDSEIEESTLKKIVKDDEGNVYDKPKPDAKKGHDICRDTPEIEIVELSSDDNKDKKTHATIIKAKGFDNGCDEFDHVRYKVMKSELFKNSMIANYRKEAQFDGLLQYLQDYSFQELLVNNNIVIIEPVRTKIEPPTRKGTNSCKITPNILKKSENNKSHCEKSKNAIRRHFFYHPIRVNKEIIEEELPNPDTVKKVRNLFEDTLKMKSPMTQDPPLIDELGLTRRATSYRNLNEDSKGTKNGGRKKVIRQLTIDTNFVNKKWDNASLSSGVSSGDLSSNNEYEADNLSPYSNKNLKENVYSSSDEYLCDSVGNDFCCESQYVSPDIMKKIRDCGTSVTYYGGKVLNSKTGSSVSPMTKAIMEEIKGLQKNCSRDCYLCQIKCRGEKCLCLSSDKHTLHTATIKEVINTSSESINKQDNQKTNSYPSFKFKLVKSNSCSSRLELTGTDDSKNPRLKYRKQHYALEDPPLYDDENSVKNKICRLESYSKGMVKTPFENKDEEENNNNINSKINTINEDMDQHENINTMNSNITEEMSESRKNDSLTEKPTDAHSFEKKFYYVNDTIDQKKSTGKFGEMVFEEFEVVESCYDSLNSNKSVK